MRRKQFEYCEQHIGDAEAYGTLIQTAFESFAERDAELARTFQIGGWSRYAWDMETATLTFLENGQPRVVATIEFAGTYASVPKTWMWAWANPSVPGAATRRLNEVREYGRKHDLVPLYADHWHAPEVHALEMAVVTAYLLDGRGVYHAPAGPPGTTVYMVITSAQWVA
jgi:hypothetical protein